MNIKAIAAIATLAAGSIFGTVAPANANPLCSPDMAQTRYALEVLGQAPNCGATQIQAQDEAFERASSYCRERGYFTANMITGTCVAY